MFDRKYFTLNKKQYMLKQFLKSAIFLKKIYIFFRHCGQKEDQIFIESDNSSNDNVEVVFRNPCIERYNKKLVNLENIKCRSRIDMDGSRQEDSLFFDSYKNEIIDKCSNVTNNEISFLPSIEKPVKSTDVKSSQINSYKVLQRKLEQKVERAKRNYSQLHDEIVRNN